ncbi:hypothetical protein BJ994_000323 [Arthrobacter pigmenti]|uniref:Uncharacterized protein n=1 Tax=Arthrobacter pigmenti TaxID=271432 RepID=A0A846RM86_9MICC|nr:hypothetical protein [Arthrobacter pigmenti]NJC21247.1 hypothetical protein [Arthrobacter pigmenti]
MSPRLLRLEGATLEELREQVRAQHGPGAQIVGAELVTVGGIRGYFARRHYEVTVELPDPEPSPQRRRGRRAASVPADSGVSGASGIDALLQHAESVEAQLHPSVSTGGDLFAALMDDLTFNTTPPPALVSAERVPPLPARPGDLAVVVGLGSDPLTVARQMASFLDLPAQAVQAHDDDGVASHARLAATELRATGVRGEFPVFLVLQRPPSGFDGPVLARLEADQVWLAVDAGRKPADTATWASEVRTAVDVHGLAVLGSARTATPATVNQLGLPVGWVDGARAASPVL